MGVALECFRPTAIAVREVPMRVVVVIVVHVLRRRIKQCRALVLYLERESEIERFLRRSRN